MKRRGLLIAALGLLVSLGAAAQAAVPRYTVRVVKTYPHDTKAFTEGLFYLDGHLFESTGQHGTSSVRKVVLDTGAVVKSVTIDKRYFGEGIAPWKGRIIGLTWQSGTGFVWNAKDFKLASTFRYTGEGWGMTADTKSLIMSDGTPTLKFLDPVSLKVTRKVDVTFDGQAIDQINELEWVKGEVLANVWRTRAIVRINPKDGKVTGLIDLTALPEATTMADPDAVANGIAYDAGGNRLFITGKMWPHLYQIELVPAGATQ